jgi:hypothetical protein
MCGRQLEQYLQSVQFDETAAHQIASFSLQQPGWFLLFFALAAGFMWLVFRGTFAGSGARWGIALLSLLLVVDLGRANQPWILWWNYADKYSSNPIIDALRAKPYEHRVAMLSVNSPRLQTLQQLHKIEWSQHAYPYYNIQSLDIVQLPRQPEDMVAFDRALSTENVADMAKFATRRWELTNTRYLLGVGEPEEAVNRQLDPEKQRIRLAKRFRLVAKPGITRVTALDQISAEIDPTGPYALYEFAGALPRAKFYDHWEVATNDAAALKTLASSSFDPQQSVLVNGESLPASLATSTNDYAAPVEFVRYSPKDIVLKCEQQRAGVLLLNDRYDPNWNLHVDGKPAKLLRCNHLMRGAYLEPGRHIVEFRFQPPSKLIYVSLAALALGAVLTGAVIATGRRETSKTTSVPQRNGPAPSPDKAREKRAPQVAAKAGK